MFGDRLRRWPNSKTTLVQHIVSEEFLKSFWMFFFQDESILNDGGTVEIHVPVNTHLNIELNDRHNGYV